MVSRDGQGYDKNIVVQGMSHTIFICETLRILKDLDVLNRGSRFAAIGITVRIAVKALLFLHF